MYLLGDAMTLVDVINLFDTDEKCREILVRLRWPAGVECLRCKMPAVELATTKQLFYCKGCDSQFPVTASTIFNDSHLPLQKWFLATLLLCEARKGMSANQIKRTLGVSYKTAWYLCHRIRAAMSQVDRPMLGGTVEIDVTYVGGKKIGKGVWAGKNAKEVVIGIRERGGDLRFFHAEDAKSGTLAKYIRENVSEDVDVMVTDEWMAYPDAMRRTGMSAKHQMIRHKERYVDG